MSSFLATKFNYRMRFLIDIDSLKKLSLIHDNVEVSAIRPVLKRSQDMYIEPILGSALYNRLLDGVEADDLTADELTLVNDYIAIVLSVACEIRMGNAITNEIRNIGLGNATDPNFQASNINGIEREKDISYKDLTFYKNRLKRFLCENAATYPLYNSTNQYGVKKEGNTNSYSQNFFINSGRNSKRKWFNPENGSYER